MCCDEERPLKRDPYRVRFERRRLLSDCRASATRWYTCVYERGVPAQGGGGGLASEAHSRLIEGAQAQARIERATQRAQVGARRGGSRCV